MKKTVNNTNFLELDGENLKLDDVVQIAANPGLKVGINADACEKILKSRAWVDQVQQEGEPVVYGINTGFGSLANVSIEKDNLKTLQRNLIKSHSAGTGTPLPIDVVRCAMLLRANTLVKGFSGIRLQVIETLLKMINQGVTPWIPEQGSVGASGDLAPLSHLALVLSTGLNGDKENHSGKAYYFHDDMEAWELLSGKEAMAFANIPRVVLEAKEGLALNNGTQISTSILLLALNNLETVIKNSDIAMAMSLETLNGISNAYREEIHQLRPHPGQLTTAANIRKLTEGSKLLDVCPERVQDAYSFRCYPQVLAGVRDTINHVKRILEIEINATNDNPIIFPELTEENKAISGGNFHAQPIAFAADFLAIAACEVGSISERRIARLSDKHLNNGLPSFLISKSGLESGLMIAQYTAAALVSENKSLAHPASIDSIPTCENQEDHVSMAPIAGRKARSIIENVYKIIAIELLYAAQGLDIRMRQLKEEGKFESVESTVGKGTAAAYRAIRNEIPFIDEDRPIYQDIEKMVDIIKVGKITNAVEELVKLS